MEIAKHFENHQVERPLVKRIDGFIQRAVNNLTTNLRRREANSYYTTVEAINQTHETPNREYFPKEKIEIVPAEYDDTDNGTRRMLLNYANPDRLSSANPEFSRTVAAIALFDGEGPIDEIAEVADVDTETIKTFQTNGVYDIESGPGGEFVTSRPLLGVNPEVNILYQAPTRVS